MPELEDVTLDQIMDERRMELALEWGERYNDFRVHCRCCCSFLHYSRYSGRNSF